MTSEARTPIKVDPATGLKTFDTRAAKANDKIVGKGYSVLDDDALKVLPEPPPGANFNAEEQAKYQAFKETRRGAADYMPMEGEFAKYLDDVYSEPPGRARGAHRRVRHPRRRRRVRRAAALAQAEPGRLRRRPLLREGRRRRRHVVLEPLPGHRLRRRVVQLLPAARGDGLRPVDEVRLRLRDPRVLPGDGDPVRLLRPLPVPHHRREDGVGRGQRALDRLHRPRRRHAGALRDPRQRHPHQPEAGPHRGHGDVPGRVVPHVALGLRRRPRGQADRHHRHRRHGGAGDPRAGQGRRRAVRVPAHPVDDRRARPARDDRRGARDVGQRAGLGARPARPLRQDLGRAHGHPGQRRLPRRQGRRLQGAQGPRAPAVAGGADREAARLELPDHGADPGPRRRHRRGSRRRRRRSSRTTRTAASARRSTTSTCRRSTCPTSTSSTPRRSASPRSTSAASSTTASSTRSTC